MARAILFTVIIALVAIYSRETFAKPTVNSLMAEHEIVEHTGDTVLETTEFSAIAVPKIAEHTEPDRLRACMKILSDASRNILRFSKRVTDVKVPPLFILGMLATVASMHAHIGGVGAQDIVCYGPNGRLGQLNFPDPELYGWPNEEYIYPSQDTGESSSIKNCVDIEGMKCDFDGQEKLRCGLQHRCKDGYVRDEDFFCVPIDSPEERTLEPYQFYELEDL